MPPSRSASPKMPANESLHNDVLLTSPAAEAAFQTLVHRLAQHLGGFVSSIEGYTELLTETLGTRQQRELSLRIMEGTTRMEQVLQQLLRYSVPVEPVRQPTTPAALIERLRILLGPDRWVRVAVRWAVDPECSMLVDPERVQQALTALVQNALEAGTATPVELHLAAVDGTLTCTVWNPQAIAGSDPRRVFAPFYSTKGGQLGLGLTLARRIAAAHGGTLALQTCDVKAGTRFALTIPIPAQGAPERLFVKNP